MINAQEILEWLSAFAVVISGALAGHYAREGMTAIQMAGAAAAILGSVTWAVTLRAWPAQAKARDSRFKD